MQRTRHRPMPRCGKAGSIGSPMPEVKSGTGIYSGQRRVCNRPKLWGCYSESSRLCLSENCVALHPSGGPHSLLSERPRSPRIRVTPLTKQANLIRFSWRPQARYREAKLRRQDRQRLAFGGKKLDVHCTGAFAQNRPNRPRREIALWHRAPRGSRDHLDSPRRRVGQRVTIGHPVSRPWHFRPRSKDHSAPLDVPQRVSIAAAVVSIHPAPMSSPVRTLPACISSSCCSMLACSCLHQAMKRSGAAMGNGSVRR
jgi:hypothetical protein